MTMPFDHTVRSLRSDREWPAAVLLVAAVLLLGLWGAWFVGAPLVRFESGSVIGITRSGALIAAFPSAAQKTLQTGQRALVRPATPATTAAMPAWVAAVQASPEETQTLVELQPLTMVRFDRNQEESGGLVAEVEVERISPAQWIWRASGQWIDTASVLLRPADNPLPQIDKQSDRR
jgi:hypothetical protein